MPARLELLEGLDPFDLLDMECARVDRFFTGLDASGWARATRCSEWSVRDLLGHLAFCEEYNRAGLDGTVADLFARAAAEGMTEMDAVNGWGVRVRASRPASDLLAQWRAENQTWRQEIRARGRDGTTDSLVGPYPSWQQAFYLAQEYATHADDMNCPVDPGETAARLGWRYRFTLYALQEYERPVSVTRGARNLVSGAGGEVSLSDVELVEAGVARLPGDHPIPAGLRAALACLA